MNVKAVHENFEEHWHEVKTLLIAKEHWELLQHLSSVREVLNVTLEGGRSITEHDRSFVQSSLQVLQDVVTSDDHPSKLHGIVWLASAAP